MYIVVTLFECQTEHSYHCNSLQTCAGCQFLCCARAMAEGFNQIVSDKLDKNNYPAWKFRMTNFLQGKGYWDYIDGENEAAPECPAKNATPEQRKALKDWTQGKSKVMYWLSMSVIDGMMGYLQSASTPAVAWKSLSKLNEENTKVRKLCIGCP